MSAWALHCSLGLGGGKWPSNPRPARMLGGFRRGLHNKSLLGSTAPIDFGIPGHNR
mgnify:CR=1 FL=1